MFVHNKSLQFEVRVNQPDPRFASLMLEQFGGANGELTAALQYFTQAFVLREKNPKMYDLFMDIATEELSHLEMVGSMITMLLDGLNDDLKMANQKCDWMPAVATPDGREQAIHQVAVSPLFLTLSGGGPDVKDSAGNPWTSTLSARTATRPWICAVTSRQNPGRKSSTSTSSNSLTTPACRIR